MLPLHLYGREIYRQTIFYTVMQETFGFYYSFQTPYNFRDLINRGRLSHFLTLQYYIFFTAFT